ncbi:hypothetical protein Patl1_18194 [Pistacia atlantica]|uniref:Uncharacterized protein n=1 Tax=Pistacia atlantica TaxID=434234 RepID=A0ACC1BXV7_9ROSI|nr:hypothetical protein Patl1_18194 [Pistacia atlantica]
MSPVEEISEDFGMRYSIGAPPLETYAIPDTGNSLMWLQCLDCIDCYKQTIPIFDPSKSSSYEPVGCETDECYDAAYSSCDMSQHIWTVDTR